MKTKDIAAEYGLNQNEFESFIEVQGLKHEVGWTSLIIDDNDVEKYVSEFNKYKVELGMKKSSTESKKNSVPSSSNSPSPAKNEPVDSSDSGEYIDELGCVNGLRTASKLILALNIVLGIAALIVLFKIGIDYGKAAYYFAGMGAVALLVIIGIAAFNYMNCTAETTENSNLILHIMERKNNTK